MMNALKSKRCVIANRGEIAQRILRTARQRGYTVAVISTPNDVGSLIRAQADCVLEVDSFLNATEIVKVSAAWKADLLHPGYGFLSENPSFAQQVRQSQIAFVGPTPENMTALGGKESAKAFAQQCQVPVLSAMLSSEMDVLPAEQWPQHLEAKGIRPPYLIKASAGGGGKGMRIVDEHVAVFEAVRRASEEAKASFGDGTIFIERYLKKARHIEIQVFGDGQGGGVFLGERECSLQRRHQKVIEEAPSAVVSLDIRKKMGEAALALVNKVCYLGAGTIEFLLDENENFYFLEMNTRLQVEHPVTENVYGVDLVDAQFELAEGRWPTAFPNPKEFCMLSPQGVSLEARILAEDPRNNFLPTPGPLFCYIEPTGKGVRVDSGVCAGSSINSSFDSMIAKLIVHGANRAQAVESLSKALENFVVLGCTTNIPFLQSIVRHPDFLAANEYTQWLEQNLTALNQSLLPKKIDDFVKSKSFQTKLSAAFQQNFNKQNRDSHEQIFSSVHLSSDHCNRIAAQNFIVQKKSGEHCFIIFGDFWNDLLIQSNGFETTENDNSSRFSPLCKQAIMDACFGKNVVTLFWAVRIDSKNIGIHFFGETWQFECPLRNTNLSLETAAVSSEIKNPMAGKVLEVCVQAGQEVAEGQLAFVMESMKMQLELRCPHSGYIDEVYVQMGQILSTSQIIASLKR